MKIKPTSKNGGVVVELGPEERQIPEQALKTPQVFKLQRILVPVDFSECSTKALQYAIPFARQFNAELTLLHVVQPYPAVPEIVPLEVESVQDGRRELDLLRKSVATDIRSTVSLRTGDPHLEITRAAAELGVDL